MKIDPKLVDQWAADWIDDMYAPDLYDYVAQRAADHALEKAAKVCWGMHAEVDKSPADCADAIRVMKGKQ